MANGKMNGSAPKHEPEVTKGVPEEVTLAIEETIKRIRAVLDGHFGVADDKETAPVDHPLDSLPDHIAEAILGGESFVHRNDLAEMTGVQIHALGRGRMIEEDYFSKNPDQRYLVRLHFPGEDSGAYAAMNGADPVGWIVVRLDMDKTGQVEVARLPLATREMVTQALLDAAMSTPRGHTGE